MSLAARHLSVTLDITAAAAAIVAIWFVVCALVNGADQGCIDRVFWALCLGGGALAGAVLIDRARSSLG
ncbi:MAG: hypothetical protein IT532_14400 [Burkholderiales bacterium]|nr:hypothetical protein [Burkholderiales bacterium]